MSFERRLISNVLVFKFLVPVLVFPQSHHTLPSETVSRVVSGWMDVWWMVGCMMDGSLVDLHLYEVDQLWFFDPFSLSGSVTLWQMFPPPRSHPSLSLSATASIRSWRALVTSTSMTLCTGTWRWVITAAAGEHGTSDKAVWKTVLRYEQRFVTWIKTHTHTHTRWYRRHPVTLRTT